MPAEPSLAADAGVLAAPAPIPRSEPAGRRVSRDEILGLARQGRIWEFIPLALRLLKQIPEDHATRLLVATNYVRLGLRTPAAEQLGLLPDGLRSEQSVMTLMQLLGSLPADEVALPARAAMCETNLRALVDRGIDITHARPAWLQGTAAERWFTTRDGNIVRRPAGAPPDDPWTRFRNDRLEAENFPFPHAANPAKPAPPHVLEGLDPPWMLLRLVRRTPTARDGYRTRISVVQEDPVEALDALACTDLRRVIADDRIRFFIGPCAGDALRADLEQRVTTRAAGPVIELSTVRSRMEPAASQIIESFTSRQVAEQERLKREVDALYSARDREWWRRRYGAPGEPLRVLIPTCRYSTFVKHSAADLADAFRCAGWQARVLIEPDDTSHLSPVAYLRELAALQPDLVVLINYTRRGLGDFLPSNLPFVCWIQDAMPHQFNAGAGATQGQFDFLVGYLHWELFKHFGFPSDRAALFPVGVNVRKFHSTPVRAADHPGLVCEIAYVSHQSETPDAMHRRLIAEAAAREPLAARIFDELRPRVEAIATEAVAPQDGSEARAAARDAARRVLGADPPDAAITLLTRQYCIPMADRILRHQMLHWAAAIAERRGWRLRIYGRGWNDHPTLSRYAARELAHDDELRASYQLAAVHLHASANWLLHQRVMECALSGGLCLSRLKRGDLAQWGYTALRALAADAPIIMQRIASLGAREHGFAMADHPAALEFLAQLGRLGEPARWDAWIPEGRYNWLREIPGSIAEPPAGWILGDLSQTTFRTEHELEVLASRAVEDRKWRCATSDMIAGRVRARYTTDALVRMLDGLIRSSLERQAQIDPREP